MEVAVHQIVTFATDVFAGNPAFVVTLPEPVPDAVLQKVAGQLGEAILSSLRRLEDDRFALRFHSHSGPLGGAGHAVAAASHVMLGETGAARGSLVLADGSERTVTREGTRIAVTWPILPFVVVDLALLVWAFRAAARASRAYEHLRLDASGLVYSRVAADGTARAFRLEPTFTSVELEALSPPENRLWLGERGRRLLVGRCLSPRERQEVYAVLKRALPRSYR